MRNLYPGVSFQALTRHSNEGNEAPDIKAFSSPPRPLPRTLSRTRSAPPRAASSVAEALGAAVLYGAAAISMNFINKASLRVYPLPQTLLLLQMGATLLVLLTLQMSRWVIIPPLVPRKAWALLPLTLLFISNVALALVGLQTLDIPMYNTLKRLTPVLVLAAKAAITRKAPECDIASSVLLIVGGCLVAGLGDFSFDLKGYICALASVTLQASYLLLVERSGAEKGVGVAELLVYNAVLSMPFLLVAVVGMGELVQIIPLAHAALASLGAWSCFWLLTANSLLGMLLNYSLFLCTVHNSALTTTIVGVLKGVVATTLGFFLLGGVPVHLLNVAGIAINTTGGTWYTAIKYRKRRRLMQQQALPVVIMSSSPGDALAQHHKAKASPGAMTPALHGDMHDAENPRSSKEAIAAVISTLRLHKNDSAQSLEHMVRQL
ncbi:hypothetical protein WJX73_006121 [Symbiochloris irregularis]|uniref:Sugar phosphate transporter domain-containing protein n=1 Tax=Symbiochloris irregularis TaxID=706552 RepID=A0AAW1NWB3_9CHLO